jgi:hypothetical protein
MLSRWRDLFGVLHSGGILLAMAAASSGILGEGGQACSPGRSPPMAKAKKTPSSSPDRLPPGQRAGSPGRGKGKPTPSKKPRREEMTVSQRYCWAVWCSILKHNSERLHDASVYLAEDATSSGILGEGGQAVRLSFTSHIMLTVERDEYGG